MCLCQRGPEHETFLKLLGIDLAPTMRSLFSLSVRVYRPQPVPVLTFTSLETLPAGDSPAGAYCRQAVVKLPRAGEEVVMS